MIFKIIEFGSVTMNTEKIKKNNPENSEGREDSKGKAKRIGATTATGNQIYQNSIVNRALKRAGKNKNLKGHINEIMTCDRFNFNPSNALKGKKAVLTKSNTAIRDDIVVKQGNKIIKRMQLKDTPSASGIQDTMKRVANHQYKGTNLVGTVETAAAYAKEAAKNGNINQKMASNGISSQTTALLAKKALGDSVGNVIKDSGKILNQAKKTAVPSAAISGGFEAVKETKRVMKGDQTAGGAVKNVVTEVGIGAASAVTGDALGTAATIAVAATPAAPAAPVVGLATSWVASGAADKVLHKGKKAAENATNKIMKNHAIKKDNQRQLELYERQIAEKRQKRLLGNTKVSKNCQNKMDALRNPKKK